MSATRLRLRLRPDEARRGGRFRPAEDAAARCSSPASRSASTPPPALAGLTFDVRRGEMFGLIGPDGAGKTTAIRLLCGLLHPDAGTVRVLGRDPVREHAEVTERVGYLSQRFRLYGDLTIDENIEFFAEIHGVRDYRPAATAARDDAAHAVPRPPGRAAVGRDEAEAGAGLHARPRARARRAGRADHRCRSRLAPRVLEAAVRVPGARRHHRDVHAVSRRSRALRPRGADARGAGAGGGRAGRLRRVIRRPVVEVVAPGAAPTPPRCRHSAGRARRAGVRRPAARDARGPPTARWRIRSAESRRRRWPAPMSARCRRRSRTCSSPRSTKGAGHA